MNKDKYVFAKMVEFLDNYKFLRIVKKYDGNKYVKHFTCWNQLLTLILVIIFFVNSSYGTTNIFFTIFYIYLPNTNKKFSCK